MYGGLPARACAAPIVLCVIVTPVETDDATTYFDTVDLRLAARQITLRHRSTGDGGAWDLRTSADDPAIA